MSVSMTKAENEATTSRRALLKGFGAYPVIAAALVGGTPGTVTAKVASPADPIHDLIKEYREAAATHLAVLAEEELRTDVSPYTPSDEQCEACYAHNDAFAALIETNPTTFAGLVALVTFLQELVVSDEWLFQCDEPYFIIPFIKNLAHALPRLSGDLS